VLAAGARRSTQGEFENVWCVLLRVAWIEAVTPVGSMPIVDRWRFAYDEVDCFIDTYPQGLFVGRVLPAFESTSQCTGGAAGPQ